jgi:predicted unusual protein kinase regulating ubiquinone biosynthesis (AarF/ABC1/UbiB family)
VSVRRGAPPERYEVEGQLLGRATQIVRVLAKHGLRELHGGEQVGRQARREQAQRLRTALEELGPTFAKLGQILSTRPDLLPPEFVNELATLQDNVSPLTEHEVVSVLEQDLGVPWEDVFDSIEATPLAAGTIGQVHRATLDGGARVVVKVQRPQAGPDIYRDLGLLELLADRAIGKPSLRQVIDLPAVIEHLATSLRHELDFRMEAANVERMRAVLEPYGRLAVPAVYHELSSARVLVMEEVQGGAVVQAPPGRARKEAARQFLESFLQQILIDGFFHADPHPGNLKWWNERIYFLDLGMVGEVDTDTRHYLLLMLMAFERGDAAFLTDVMLMLAGEDQRGDLDVPALRTEITLLVGGMRGHGSLAQIQLGPLLQSLTEIAARNRIRLPSALALTGKALAQMQLAASELDPELDPFDVAGRFLLRNAGGDARRRFNAQSLAYETQKLRLRFTRLVESVERMAGSRPGPKLQVKLTGTEALEVTIRNAARRVSLAVVAGACLGSAGITAGSSSVGEWVPLAFGVFGAVLIAGLLVDLVRRRS